MESIFVTASSTTPSLQAMAAFCRVVEQRSFHAAARSLDTTGGSVSKLVAQLERDLGARLLHRTTRTLSVTGEGERYYEAAVRILDEVALAGEQLRSQSAAVSGRLKVSVPTSYALMWLSPRLAGFQVAHPLLTLDLSLDDRYVDLVAEGFDCALRIATQLPDSQLVARTLGRVQRVVVAAPAYLRQAAPLERPEQLAAHNCLVYTQTATPHAWPLAGTAQGRPVEVQGSLRVNNSVLLRDALLAGQGVTLTPRFVVDDLLATGALVEVLTAYRPRDLSVFGVTANQRHIARKVRVWMDFVEQQMSVATAASPGAVGVEDTGGMLQPGVSLAAVHGHGAGKVGKQTRTGARRPATVRNIAGAPG